MSWLDKFLKPEAPKPHELSSYIGYCPECHEIHITDDIAKIMELGDISKRLREKFNDYKYVCLDCGVPLGRSKEEVSKYDSCWFCGGKKATTRESYEKRRRRK